MLCTRLPTYAQNRPGPNVIYIYADDLGYGELGCYGQQKISTPHLDQMAAEGMRFTQHYAGAPVCAPSRCMLLTGRHPGHSYIRGNYELGGFADSLEGGQMPLPEGTFTLGHLMKKAGYTTAVVGKWGLGMINTTGHPLRQGFDYFYGLLDQKQAHNYYPTHLWENERWDTLRNPAFTVHRRIDPAKAIDADFEAFKGKDYAPEKMTEKAMAFMEKNRSKPFFLYLAYPLPHLALQAPDSWVQPYIGKFDEKPYYGQNGYAPAKYPLSTYAAMITGLDAQVGRIMEKLKQLGLDDNTLVCFSSDNGATFTGGVHRAFFNSNGPLRGGKMEVFEGGIRVPLIVRWKGKVQAGSTSNFPSTQYDILATLAGLIGQKAPPNDGITLLPELLHYRGLPPRHEYLYFEYPENGGQLAVRMDNWKGVKLQVRQQPENPWMLFDLDKDAGETTDISAQYPYIIKRFNEIVQREHTQSHIREWEFVKPKFDVKQINK